MPEEKIGHTFLGMHVDDSGFNADLFARAILEFYGLTCFRLEGLPKKGRFYQWMVGLVDAFGKRCGQIEFGGERTRLKGHNVEFSDGSWKQHVAVITTEVDGVTVVSDVKGLPPPVFGYTARVEIGGRGCEVFEGRTVSGAHRPRPWALLREKFENGPTVWITRADIALDLFKGQLTLEDCIKWHGQGLFDRRGQRPRIKGNVELDRKKDGSTIYIGSPQSNVYFRAYEKGPQLGDPDSEWIRFELQWRAREGRIGFGVMTDPASALRGAYAALGFVQAETERDWVLKARVKATAASAMRWVAFQYGKALNWLFVKSGSEEAFLDAFKAVCSEHLPEWAHEPLHEDEWPPALRAALGIGKESATAQQEKSE